MAKARTELPVPLAKAARRFEYWRGRRTQRRIPANLWSLASDSAVRNGVRKRDEITALF